MFSASLLTECVGNKIFKTGTIMISLTSHSWCVHHTHYFLSFVFLTWLVGGAKFIIWLQTSKRFKSLSKGCQTTGVNIPGRVPLLAMKLAMSMCWLSIRRFFMQPMNCRLRTGKSSGSFGTPPRRSGPVRSSDLKMWTFAQTLFCFASSNVMWRRWWGYNKKFITEIVLQLFSHWRKRINIPIKEKKLMPETSFQNKFTFY